VHSAGASAKLCIRLTVYIAYFPTAKLKHIAWFIKSKSFVTSSDSRKDYFSKSLSLSSTYDLVERDLDLVQPGLDLA